jgi:type II secretion system protein C
MLRILFLVLYLCTGVYLLFQASRLAGTVTERVIRQNTPAAREHGGKQTDLPDSDSLLYDASISLSPLFSYQETATVTRTEDGEAVVTDSPVLRRYELNGVIILPKGRSIALIRKSGQRESTIYRIGDMIEQMEIVKIEQKQVHLSSGGNTIILPMYYRFMVKKAGRNAPPPVREETPEEYAGARKVQKVLSRSDVEDKVFNRANEILTQIAISPYMVDGGMEGLRLIRVPKGNIVYELGGRSGDLVKRVNGHELNQIDQMYKLWENIKDDSRITVDLERNKQIYSFDFEIRE